MRKVSDHQFELLRRRNPRFRVAPKRKAPRNLVRPLTVCIAAICDMLGKVGIVGASDRMLTTGDIEYERPVPKIFSLNESIVAMIAGDAGAQDEICNCTRERLGPGSFSVRDAVDTYCAEVGAYQVKNGERKILAPLGLTMQTFIARQRELGRSFANQILYDLSDLRNELQIETIIAGIDPTGHPHIYTVDGDGSALCNDSAGFAAIGIGASHAESQFMFQRYSPRFEFGPAILLLYTAKRRAEVAPGVGVETDMFLVRSDKKIVTPMHPDLGVHLETMYASVEQSQNDAITNANETLSRKLREALESTKARKAAAAAAEASSGDKAAEGVEIPGDNTPSESEMGSSGTT
jgi:20S proteasome alpha/beta subunit